MDCVNPTGWGAVRVLLLPVTGGTTTTPIHTAQNSVAVDNELVEIVEPGGETIVIEGQTNDLGEIVGVIGVGLLDDDSSNGDTSSSVPHHPNAQDAVQGISVKNGTLLTSDEPEGVPVGAICFGSLVMAIIVLGVVIMFIRKYRTAFARSYYDQIKESGNSERRPLFSDSSDCYLE